MFHNPHPYIAFKNKYTYLPLCYCVIVLSLAVLMYKNLCVKFNPNFEYDPRFNILKSNFVDVYNNEGLQKN